MKHLDRDRDEFFAWVDAVADLIPVYGGEQWEADNYRKDPFGYPGTTSKWKAGETPESAAYELTELDRDPDEKRRVFGEIQKHFDKFVRDKGCDPNTLGFPPIDDTTGGQP